MPITKSAKKALRVSKRRHAINLRVKRAYKGAVKDVRRLVTVLVTKQTKTKKKPATPLAYSAEAAASATKAGRQDFGGQAAKNTEKSAETLKKTEPLKKALTKAYSELDKAAKKGVIHKNKASRLKSRLAELTRL